MFSNFPEFLVCLRDAKFTFGVIWDYITELYYAITANPNISVIWNGMMNGLRPVNIMFLLAVVAVCIVFSLFGKKLFPIFKFCAFFVLGFVLGTHLLAPLLPPEVNIPAWVVGIVVALIAAVLSKFLYIIVYVLAVGYSAYVLAYYCFYLQPDATYSNSRAIVCVITALVIVVLSLVFRKYIEMFGTAVLGAWSATWVFANYVYNFTVWPLFGGNAWLGTLLVTILLSILGAFVQFKTRRRY